MVVSSGRFLGIAVALLMILATGGVHGDLEHRRSRTLSDAENAWGLWAPALERLAEPPPDDLSDVLRKAYSFGQPPPTGEERQRLQEWLGSLRDPLAQISRGLERGRLQFLLSAWDAKNLTSFTPLLRVARYRVALGRFCMFDGDWAGAARLFVEVYRMGRLISEGDGFAIHRWVGNAIQGIGLDALRPLAAGQGTPIPLIESMAAGLSAPTAEDASLERGYRAEFTHILRPTLAKIAEEYAALPDKIRKRTALPFSIFPKP